MIDRIYFREATYVGLESYQSLPPVVDMEQPRRGCWTFTESPLGVDIEYRPWGKDRLYCARIPWGNVKGVVYAEGTTPPSVHNPPAPSTPAAGVRRV